MTSLAKYANYDAYNHAHLLFIMVILRSQNKITDFLMILAWASHFKFGRHYRPTPI